MVFGKAGKYYELSSLKTLKNMRIVVERQQENLEITGSRKIGKVWNPAYQIISNDRNTAHNIRKMHII